MTPELGPSRGRLYDSIAWIEEAPARSGGRPDRLRQHVIERAVSNGSRIRARQAGLVSPVSHRPLFRIEDGAGRVLRRIGSARSPAEALAHYWRAIGRDAKFAPAMAEPPSDARLRRRIEAARSRGRDAPHADMQTRELPLPDPGEQPAPAPRPARRQRRVQATNREPDLFGPAEPDRLPTAAEPEPEPAAPLVEPAPPRDAEAPSGSFHLDPHATLLQQVDPRNLRPSDRNDSYLYHVTNDTEAAAALEGGLMVSAQDPIILTERQGVQYWLSVVAEDFDVILDGPANLAVLRLRRIAVESLIEQDPDASRSAGCACYLLTGGGLGANPDAGR